MTGRVEKVKQHKLSRTKVLELAGMVEQRSVSRKDEVFRVIRLRQDVIAGKLAALDEEVKS
jgi:hypothetical protein